MGGVYSVRRGRYSRILVPFPVVSRLLRAPSDSSDSSRDGPGGLLEAGARGFAALDLLGAARIRRELSKTGF